MCFMILLFQLSLGSRSTSLKIFLFSPQIAFDSKVSIREYELVGEGNLLSD